MTRIRIVPALGVVAAAALVLAGCSSDAAPGGEPVDTSKASGTVRLIAPEDPATFAPVIEKFKKVNPDITVEYTQVPFDQYANTLQQRLGAKDDTIDVVAIDQPHISQLAAQGFLEDLSDLKDRAKPVLSDAQYNINFYGDKMWALSVWDSTQMMFYNKDALEKAGVEAPSIDPEKRWTWEQTIDAAKKVQASGATESGFLFEQVEAYYQLHPLVESLGGGSGISGDDMLTVDVTTPEWQKAMTWYQDTFASGVQPRGVGGFQTSPVFIDGKVAFYIGGPWDVGRFENEATVDWGIAPHPYFEGGTPVTPNGSWSWGVNAASKNKAAARAFLEYVALDAEGNLATTEATTVIPTHKDAAVQYLPSLEKLGGEHSVGVADLITYETQNTAVARPSSVGYVQFEALMAKAFADIRNGSEVATRLEQANAQIQDAWSRLK